MSFSTLLALTCSSTLAFGGLLDKLQGNTNDMSVDGSAPERRRTLTTGWDGASIFGTSATTRNRITYDDEEYIYKVCVGIDTNLANNIMNLQFMSTGSKDSALGQISASPFPPYNVNSPMFGTGPQNSGCWELEEGQCFTSAIVVSHMLGSIRSITLSASGPNNYQEARRFGGYTGGNINVRHNNGKCLKKVDAYFTDRVNGLRWTFHDKHLRLE